MLIFLLGFMGSGKSHCGKKIAAHFDCPFIDLDHAIEQSASSSVSQIFSMQGESAFRELERDALRNIVHVHQASINTKYTVVACGGGTPCFHGNMDFMNENGLTVWLNPPVETLIQRLKKGQLHRPLIKDLTHHALESYIKEKMNERSSFYSKAVLIETSDDCPLTLIQKHIQHV